MCEQCGKPKPVSYFVLNMEVCQECLIKLFKMFLLKFA